MLNKIREFIIRETGGMGPTEEAEKLLNAVDTLENTIHNLTEQLNFYKQESDDQFKGNQELMDRVKALEKESEWAKSMYKCIIHGFEFDNEDTVSSLRNKIRQLKEQALLGRALKKAKEKYYVSLNPLGDMIVFTEEGGVELIDWYNQQNTEEV